MPLARYQGTAVDDQGSVLPLAEITVTNEATGALAVLYSDRDGLVADVGNPFTAEADGSFSFHIAGGAYRIDLVLGGSSRALRYVAVGTGSEFDIEDVLNGVRIRARVATTANVTISTALNNADTLDGVTLATGDIVLVKDQTTKSQNGVYVVGVSPARHTSFDSYDEHVGAQVMVASGTAGGNTLWLSSANAGGVLDTTDIEFTKVAFAAPSLGDLHAVTISTSDPSGGVDGDVWFKVT